MEYDYSIKTIIIGDSCVGKSCILNKFVDDNFNNDANMTIGVDYKTCRIDYANKTIKLLIWDTAGQERFQSLTKAFYKNAEVIIIVFDITNIKSFTNIDYWIKEIEKEIDMTSKYKPIIFV